MAQANQDLRITNGPSRWDLMLSLLDNVVERRVVTFYVIETDAAGPQEFRGVIHKLEREDDLGWRWLFEGTFEVVYGRHIKTSPRKGAGVFDLRNRGGRFSWVVGEEGAKTPSLTVCWGLPGTIHDKITLRQSGAMVLVDLRSSQESMGGFDFAFTKQPTSFLDALKRVLDQPHAHRNGTRTRFQGENFKGELVVFTEDGELNYVLELNTNGDPARHPGNERYFRIQAHYEDLAAFREVLEKLPLMPRPTD